MSLHVVQIVLLGMTDRNALKLPSVSRQKSPFQHSKVGAADSIEVWTLLANRTSDGWESSARRRSPSAAPCASFSSRGRASAKVLADSRGTASACSFWRVVALQRLEALSFSSCRLLLSRLIAFPRGSGQGIVAAQAPSGKGPDVNLETGRLTHVRHTAPDVRSYAETDFIWPERLENSRDEFLEYAAARSRQTNCLRARDNSNLRPLPSELHAHSNRAI